MEHIFINDAISLFTTNHHLKRMAKFTTFCIDIGKHSTQNVIILLPFMLQLLLFHILEFCDILRNDENYKLLCCNGIWHSTKTVITSQHFMLIRDLAFDANRHNFVTVCNAIIFFQHFAFV